MTMTNVVCLTDDLWKKQHDKITNGTLHLLPPKLHLTAINYWC